MIPIDSRSPSKIVNDDAAARRAVQKIDPDASLPPSLDTPTGVVVPSHAEGYPIADTSEEISALRHFADDEGLVVWAGDLGGAVPEHLIGRDRRIKTTVGRVTPTEYRRLAPDGKVSTALGRLTPEENRQQIKAGRIDTHGNLTKRVQVTKQKGRIREAPVLLEEYLASQDARRQAEAEAEAIRAERRAKEHADAQEAQKRRERPASPTARRFNSRPGWVPPGSAAEEADDDFASDPLCESDEVVDGGDPYVHDRPSDGYDTLAEIAEPSDAEEDAAWERVHGLPDGWIREQNRAALEAAERDWQARRDLAQAAALAAFWSAEIHERREAGEGFDPDPVRRCENPNGCTNVIKGRGSRCAPCYKYRRNPAHLGEERTLRLINQERARNG
ncbi:MAG: hypothetical protein JWM85_2236 [Acidimicrobiaceae bacterium]|nr:hypothetical protein [Acidimicrobiaceae bacterium]